MSLDTEIWEVVSDGSGCSLDDELSQELEELEKREEQLKLLGGSAEDSSHTPAVNGGLHHKPGMRASLGSGTDDSCGDIIFKSTGVLNVADCNEVADGYKGKRAYRRYGLSGAGAQIARRERQRLNYQRQKMDPVFAARRSEYRRRYRQKVKMLDTMRKKREIAAVAAAAAASGAGGGSVKPSTNASGSNSGESAKAMQQMVFIPVGASASVGVGGGTKGLPSGALVQKKKYGNKKMIKNYKMKNNTSNTNSINNASNKFGGSKFGGGWGPHKYSVGGDKSRGVSENDLEVDLDELSSDLSAGGGDSSGGQTETLRAMRMRFCPANVVPDDGSTLPSPVPNTKAGKPSISAPFRSSYSSSAYDHTQKVFGKIQMVSLRRFKHLQLLHKRVSSKVAYYQTVMRRDRAIIGYMRQELEKFGSSLDFSHLKLPNFRLKNMVDPTADVMHKIDDEEAQAYSRILAGDSVDYDDGHRDGEMKGDVAVEDADESPWTPAAEDGQKVKQEQCVVVKLEKAVLGRDRESNVSSGHGSIGIIEKKKQIAVKSSRGGLKINVKRLTKSPGGSSYDSDESLKKFSARSKDVNKFRAAPTTPKIQVQKLQEKAIREGRAFAELKAKCVLQSTDSSVSSRSNGTQYVDRLSNCSKSLPYGQSPSNESTAPTKRKYTSNGASSPARSVTVNSVSAVSVNGKIDTPPPGVRVKRKYTFKKKKTSPKKVIRKELQDDLYVPNVPIDLSDLMTDVERVRDDVLYEDVLRCRDQSEQSDALGVGGAGAVTPELKQRVQAYVEETTAYERSVHSIGGSAWPGGGGAGGDAGSEEGSVVEGYDLGGASPLHYSTNGSVATSLSSGSNNSSSSNTPTSRDQFLGLLHKRFLATHTDSCSLKAFAECLPTPLLVRRSSVSRGYTPCVSCGQTELLYENLVTQGVLDFKSDFEDVWQTRELRAALMASLCDGTKGREDSAVIPHLTWNRSYKGNFSKNIKTSKDTVGTMVKALKKELGYLEPHLEQLSAKFSVLRAVLERCSHSTDEALVHVAWSEFPKVYHRSVSNQIVADQCITVLCGYVWTKGREYAFCCVADGREHCTSALWAHLEDPLKELVEEVGCKRLFLVSDPTISLFRNKAQFYYMNEFAVKRSVELRWIFSANYHTQLKSDMLAHKVKELVEKVSLMQVKMLGDNPYRSAHTMIEMLQEKTDMKLYFVSSDAVADNISGLPTLQPIKGTQTFAEVLIAPGKFLVKLDSLDEFWTKVLIIF